MKKTKIKELFATNVDESTFAPKYENENLFPLELDIKHSDYNKMSYEEQFLWSEKLRLHLYNLAINYNHSIFGSNNNIEEIVRDCKKLIDYDIYKDVKEVKNRKYLTHGNINPSNQWFPEMIDTKIVGKSLLDMLKNQKVFFQNIDDILGKDRHKVGSNSMGEKRVSQFLISSLRIVNRFQPAFNFPATLARLIYTIYFEEYFDKSEEEIWVYDSCAGWSGRMTGLLAAFSSHQFAEKKVKYYCTDVNKNTIGSFEKITKFWNNYINSRIERDFKLYRSFTPAENIFNDLVFDTLKKKFNVAFTSPPYFNREVYSSDANQSANLYSTYNEWRDNFLFGMLKNTHELLKPNGICFINIADINTNKGDGSFYPLQEDTVKIAKEIGFQVIDIYYMISHIFPGNDTAKNTVEIGGSLKKYEPIFVMKKL